MKYSSIPFFYEDLSTTENVVLQAVDKFERLVNKMDAQSSTMIDLLKTLTSAQIAKNPTLSQIIPDTTTTKQQNESDEICKIKFKCVKSLFLYFVIFIVSQRQFTNVLRLKILNLAPDYATSETVTWGSLCKKLPDETFEIRSF